MKYQDLKPVSDDEITLAKFMAKHARFKQADLDRLGIAPARVSKFMSRLRSTETLRIVDRKNRQATYTVFDTDAAVAFDESKRSTATGAMWSAMRVLKEFTPEDILAIVSPKFGDATVEAVKKYALNLVKSEYLTVVEKAKAGGRSARYRLINDTGPLAPQIKRLQCVVDGNTDRAVYVEGARQ